MTGFSQSTTASNIPLASNHLQIARGEPLQAQRIEEDLSEHCPSSARLIASHKHTREARLPLFCFRFIDVLSEIYHSLSFDETCGGGDLSIGTFIGSIRVGVYNSLLHHADGCMETVVVGHGLRNETPME